MKNEILHNDCLIAGRSNINLYNADCMEYMKGWKDNEFELAIVDPPYGLGKRLSSGGGKLKDTPMAKLYKNSSQWDIKPNKEYFDELFRISKNQIICGANYFIEYLFNSRGGICWDKLQPMPTLSSWEFLWTSFDRPAKIFSKSSMDLNRFHPTQKPVALYKWLLKNYANEGDRIIDTHFGSCSIGIACWDMKFDLTAFEIDKEYFESAVKRINQHTAQLQIF